MTKLRNLLVLLGLFSLFASQTITKIKARTLSEKIIPNWNCNLLIIGGAVVTKDKDGWIIEDGAVTTTNGKIGLVGKGAAVKKSIKAKQMVDANGKAIIPDLINAQNQVPMSLFRGIADDLAFKGWLTKYIFSAEAKMENEDFVRGGRRAGLVEIIRGDTTTFCDVFYYEGAIADETFKAGMRGVLRETVIDFPLPDNRTWAAAIATEKSVNKWQRNPLIAPASAPHSPYTVSEAYIQAEIALSDELNALLVMHLADADSERNISKRSKQASGRSNMRKIWVF